MIKLTKPSKRTLAQENALVKRAQAARKAANRDKAQLPLIEVATATASTTEAAT